ncbi:MAG: hypothetical protein V1716_01860 [Candidatus Uhrbacteria bacterium]
MDKKISVLLVASIGIIILSAAFCVWFYNQNYGQGTFVNTVVESGCGDGVCDKTELKKGMCPEDCVSGGANTAPITNPPVVVDDDTSVNSNVVYLGLMVHLEKVNDELTNETSFRNHAAAIRKLAQIFEEHKAKATFESGSRFTQACGKWNDNVLKELYDQGQGIGLHADLGGNDNTLTQEEFTQELGQMKTELEQELGLPVEHVSGICSASLDWVKGAIDTGFKFTTGTVGFCAMSLPLTERPVEFQNCSVPTECHGEIPLEIKDRVHPWLTSVAANWLTNDPNGQLAIFPANNIWAAFSSEDENAGRETFGFDERDIEIYFEKLDEALKYAADDQTNMFYVGWSIGTDEEIKEELFDQFFAELQPYIDSGQVQWKTFPEMYDKFVEKGQK